MIHYIFHLVILLTVNMSVIVSLLQLTASFGFVVSLCIAGIFICIYAIKVEAAVFAEKKKNGKPQFNQACDLGEHVSCSLVLTSKYSHMAKLMFKLDEKSMFNLSNAQYGLMYYTGLLIFHLYPFSRLPFHSELFLLGTTGSVVASLGLAYILKYILGNLCLICVGMYIVNALLFVSSIMRVV